MPVRAKLDRVAARQPLSSVVFDQLLDRIVGGGFRAGEALPSERQLTAELGVSRTAVREALARLAQLRLIQIRHGGETRVLDFRVTAGLDLLPSLLRRANGRISAEVARSGFEMRAALGPDMARLTAERRDDRVVAELERLLEEMAAADGELGALQQLSLAFWTVVSTSSGNIAYQLAFNTLRESIKDLPGLAHAQAAELRDLRGYRAMADAIRKHDSAAAMRAARTHIGIGLEGIAQMHRKRGAS
ncbi:MAG: FadR family transcriptional regulator [Deltaproteobacteria bacterium]|nr:FadR family transcriptional regulator [Deltaproteobacteria bacterium]